jgi:hypothetical protein
MPIKFVQHGNFSKTEKFFERCKNLAHLGVLNKYGREGVVALAMATPVDTGETACAWRYEVKNNKGNLTLSWLNDAVSTDGTPIVVYVQYGHATRNGGYVRGRDFINPTIQPIFDKIADDLWKEVTK